MTALQLKRAHALTHSQRMASIVLSVIGCIDYLAYRTILTCAMFHVIVKIQVTGEAKASHTLDKLEIYGDHRFWPLHSSHVDLCLILLRC